CSVIDAIRAQMFAHAVQRGIEPENSLHVAGVPYVHGRGQRRYTGPRLPISRGEEIGHGAVDVVRQNDARKRESQFARPQKRTGVQELARGNDVGRLRARLFCDLQAGGDVVNHLRQQPADIDAVRGAETMLAAQYLVAKGGLNQLLTIIEGFVDSHSQPTPAPMSAGGRRPNPLRPYRRRSRPEWSGAGRPRRLAAALGIQPKIGPRNL